MPSFCERLASCAVVVVHDRTPSRLPHPLHPSNHTLGPLDSLLSCKRLILISFPAGAMLSYPDRHRFQEIRSKWEAAQVVSDCEHINMVGRKEKPAAHRPLNHDEDASASKFRRKLSQGLSLISHPLSQRRTTPVRPSPLSNGGTKFTHTPRPQESASRKSSIRDPSIDGSSSVRFTTPKIGDNLEMGSDIGAIPKPLPRSRTMSFIPRPREIVSESSTNDIESANTQRPSTSYRESNAQSRPSKIPSPVPQNPTPRRVSPRQHTPTLTAQQAKYVAAGGAFAGCNDQSPSKTSARSYTTPNLNAVRPSDFMSQRKPSQHKSYSTVSRQNKKENDTPSNHQMKRLSNIEEQSPRREAGGTHKTATRNHTSGVAGIVAKGRHVSRAVTTSSGEHGSPRVIVKTPFSSQRAVHKRSRGPTGNTVASQARLSSGVNPSAMLSNGSTTDRTNLPQSSTEKDLRKKTLSSPYKRIGSVRSLVGSHGQVSVTRSPKHSDLDSALDDIPPVPPIPDKYKSSSMPVLLKNIEPPFFHPYMGASEQGVQAFRSRPSLQTASSAYSSESLLSSTFQESQRKFSASAFFSAKSSSNLASTLRPRTSKQSLIEDNADLSVFQQIKDAMPALYWAGRFQSRFDQWRTQAMQAELSSESRIEGLLAQCSIHQEKAAACHIFLQLREMCASIQAADSLWV